MRNKREQLQAYRYLVARLVSALVRAEPDAPETPLRRSTTGTVIGAILGVVVVAGCAVVGLIAGGKNTAWQQPGAIVVEEETGNRFVYLDGTLRPVLNYSSALLAAGGRSAAVTTVSRKSLAGVPHGSAIGILGAPDAMPSPDVLSPGPWYACGSSHQQDNGTTTPAVLLTLDDATAARPVPESQAVLVGAGDTLFLVWRDERLRVEDPSVLFALGFSSVPVVQVSPAWLNTLTTGPDLAAHLPDGVGDTGQSVGGVSTRIGQVLASVTATGRREQFVVRNDGLAALSETDAALLLANPAEAAAYPGRAPVAIAVEPGALAQARPAPGSATTAGYPQTPPTPVNDPGERSLCTRLTFSASLGVHVQLVTVPAVATRLARTDQPAAVGAADRVAVPPSGGALVVAQAAPGVSAGSLFLVTDLGVKYPVPTPDVAASLGYGGVRPLAVPTPVLGLVPTGPVLDPAAARTEWRQQP